MNDDNRRKTLHREERRFRQRRLTVLINGSLLILGSSLLMLIGMGQAAKEYGPLGFLFGWIPGGIMLAVGILAVRYSKKMKRPSWLENLQFRDRAGADRSQSPPPAPGNPDR